MIAAGSLLIVAYLSLGALLQLLAGDLATGLGLAGLFVSPAFGYAGVGFPTVGMNAFAQVWSAILPLRWYMAVLLGQAARGLPVSESAGPFAALAGLTVLYAGLALLRMRSVTRNRRFETRERKQPGSGARKGSRRLYPYGWRCSDTVPSACCSKLLWFRRRFLYEVLSDQIIRKLPSRSSTAILAISAAVVRTLDSVER